MTMTGSSQPRRDVEPWLRDGPAHYGNNGPTALYCDAPPATQPGFRIAIGFGGVHVIPMRLRDEIIGTLNLFHAAAGPDPVTARVARSMVDVATIGLLPERALRHQEILTEQLQTALNSRVLIEQAKGILAERYGFDPERAFTVLRRYARNHNRPLTALARDVITGAVQITGTTTAT